MPDKPFLFIAGPCVIESEDLAFEVAKHLKEIARGLPIEFVFKASFDKANRTRVDSFRGPGLEEGLRILDRIKRELGLKVLTDVHEVHQVESLAKVVDIIQIPAFLCRQTDLLVAAGRSGVTVNLKKGQFVSPHDMKYTVEKVESTGAKNILLTERGSCFGYNNLVVDFRSFSILKEFGYPVVFDATHAVQIPSQGGVSSGRREYVPPLARAAAAYGIDGLFCECHPEPDKALSDGANSLPLAEVQDLLQTTLRVREASTS